MKKILYCFLSFSILFSYKISTAQVPTCGVDVPFFQVDLTGEPAGSWESPSHFRKDNCCGTTSPDRCTSFEILLDTGAAMINFEIASGAIPPGSMFYQIGCGPQIAVGEPICVVGPGPHHLTFCKPGNNENTYMVTSIPKPIIPDDDSTRIGCSLPLEILGLNNITITSINPGFEGQYDSYLSCTDCATPDFSPGLGAPDFIDYKICGSPIASICGFVFSCDTVRLHVFEELQVTTVPNPAEFCSGGSVLLNAFGGGGDSTYSFTWVNSSNDTIGTNSTYSASAQGNYTVLLDDGLSSPTCPASEITIPVTEGIPPTVIAGGDQMTCANDPEVFLGGSVTDALGGIWTGGSGTFDPDNTSLFASYTPSSAEIDAGFVTLTLTSTGAGGGCVDDSDDMTITYSDTLEISFTTPTLLCNGATGTLTANVSNGTPPYEYLWSNGDMTSSTTVGEGAYWVDVTDFVGCIHRENVVISSPSALSISMSSTDVSVDGGSDGTASVIVSGGTAPYSYLWSNSDTGPTATGLSYGVASVTITDVNGCIIFGEVVVNEPQCSAFTASASSTNVSCFGGNDGSGSASAVGGTPGYNFSWNTAPVTVGANASNLSAGTYTVTVTDGGGCIDLAVITVTEPTQLSNNMTHTDIPVFGDNTGEATANPTGGTPNYDYLWSPDGQTTQSISNQFAGTYYVDITDDNSCVITDSVIINEPPCYNFVLGVSTTNVSCNGLSDGTAEAVVAHGTPPYSYLWSGGQTDSIVTGLAAGLYSVTVTDGANCVTFETFTISEPSPLSIGLVPTMVSCNGMQDGTIDLTVSGGVFAYSFVWKKGLETIGFSEDLVNLSPGTYSVEVTDVNGCIAIGSTGITEPSTLSVSTIEIDAVCSGDFNGDINTTTVGGVLPYTFSWTGPSAYSASTEDIMNLGVGLYELDVQDANGCALNEPHQVFIDEPNEVVIHTITTDCPNPGELFTNVSVDSITGGDEIDYDISFNNGSTYHGLGVYQASLAIGTTHQVLAQDGNGCLTPATFALTIEPAVLIDNISFDPCVATGVTDIPVTITPSGGTGAPYSVSSDNGATFGAPGTLVLNLPVGNSYQIVVKDSKGCESVASSITIPDEISTSLTITNEVSCLGESDGSLDLSVSGGTTPYSYSWSGPNSFSASTEDISNLIEGAYSIEVTDANSCTFNDGITLTTFVDVTLPEITCPSDINQNNDFGVCEAVVNYAAPVGTDNCPLGINTNLTAGLASGSSFPVGTNLVTYTVTDSVGNSASCSFNVIIADVEAPLITCPVDVNTTTDASVCEATNVSLGSPITSDNCGVATVTNNAPLSFPTGNTVVTWTVTDIYGNTNSCTQNVMVTDAEDPTINCPAQVNVFADATLCEATGVSLGSPTTNDNCGVSLVTNDAPASYPVGTTIVTWIVTDLEGNTASCSQNVIVDDNEDPSITCPDDVVVNNDLGDCSTIAANVSLGNPVTSDNCGVATVTNNAPAVYNVGVTVVTWTVTDIHGNVSTCTQNVTVLDNELPVLLACAAPVSVTADPSACSASGVSLGLATATDNCGIASITNDAPASFPLGLTVVTWTIEDIHGNSITCEQEVTVTDDEDPTIICPGPINQSADAGVCEALASNVNLGSPTVNDNCSVATVTNDAPSSFPVGLTVVTWTVEDGSGNTNTCTQDVTITDDEDPTISCPLDVIADNEIGDCFTDASNVSLGNPTVGDNCDVATITNNAPAVYNVGVTTVTWTVTDIHGNSANCTQDVTIVDNENPIVLSCAAPVTSTLDPSSCFATGITLGNPTVSDNCGILSVVNDAPLAYPVGETIVTWTITDIHGNVTTCEQLVTILDDQEPVLSCPPPVNVLADAGLCEATGVVLGSPTINDNCGIATVTNDAPASYPVGLTVVTWTVTDSHGNSTFCTQDVTVVDDQDPTITCPLDVTVENQLGDCSTDAGNVSLGNPVVDDNCGIATITNNAPAVYPVGITTVTWIVTDVNGNTASCTQDVEIIDTENPVVTICAAPVSVTADPGICGATNIFLGNPTVIDNCGVSTITNDAPALFPVGTTVVTWTITDIYGNSITCPQDVTVTDDEDPTITCPALVNVTADPDVCFATNVNLGTPVTDDNCTVASISNDAPASFPVGTTVVTWTVVDEAGNSSICTQDVVVSDDELPTISCAADVSVFNDMTSCSTDPINVDLGSPIVLDNCGIDNIVNDAPASFPVGTTVVTWTVTDIHGNSAICVQNVTIVDNEQPFVVNCAPPVTVTAVNGICGATSVALGSPDVTDNCGIASMTNDAPALFPVGVTIVTWTITDIHGNSITCEQEVTVTDDEIPTITCPPTPIVSADAGFCYATNVDLGTPTVADNCGVESITNDAPSIFPVGTTVVTWIVSDIHKNVDTCYQDVIVEDNEAPTLTFCPSDTSSCDPRLHYQIPSASDNCGIASIVQVSGFGPGADFPVGTTTEVWEITDIHGNISFCTFDVTIHPLPLPSLSPTDVSCYSYGDGEIDLVLLDGTAPYEYLWSNGDTTQNIDSLFPGEYSVLVTDVFGCQGSGSAGITQPDTLMVQEIHNNVSCYGVSDGNIDLSVSGGTAPYSYIWNNGANSQDLSAIIAGEYMAIVTDFNGCTYDISINVDQPDSLVITGTVIDAVCEGANGGIDITPSGGTIPYNYLWSNGDTIQDIDSVTMGMYDVLVTDANGCEAIYINTIDSYSVMTIGRDIFHPLCFGGEGSIEITVSDGTAPYSYEWSNGDTTDIITGIEAGFYSVTVTDANLCKESAQYELIEPDSLALDLVNTVYSTGDGVSGYDQQDGEIDLTVFGGSEPYSINWNIRDNDENPYNLNGLGAGLYTVTVTDANGCTTIDTISITQPMDLEIPTGFTPNSDGYNDYFVIRGVEAFPDNQLLIYNRWGNLVYSKDRYFNEWNGLNNNDEELPTGTYFVVFTINSGNLESLKTEIPYSGYVDLRRTR